MGYIHASISSVQKETTTGLVLRVSPRVFLSIAFSCVHQSLSSVCRANDVLNSSYCSPLSKHDPCVTSSYDGPSDVTAMEGEKQQLGCDMTAQLPRELWIAVLSYLHWSDLLPCAAVSRCVVMEGCLLFVV